jgi:hypothetical protein
MSQRGSFEKLVYGTEKELLADLNPFGRESHTVSLT